MNFERPITEIKEQPKDVTELLDAWLAKQASAEGLFKQFGNGDIPQERYQELQEKLEERQSAAATTFEQLAREPGLTLAAIAERRRAIAESYKKGLQHTAKEQESAGGQKILSDKLTLLDKLEEQIYKYKRRPL